jgi:hypothetical protein
MRYAYNNQLIYQGQKTGVGYEVIRQLHCKTLFRNTP